MAFWSGLKELFTFQAPVEQAGEQETPPGQLGQKEKKDQPKEKTRAEKETELLPLSPSPEMPSREPKSRFRLPVRAAAWPKFHAPKTKPK